MNGNDVNQWLLVGHLIGVILWIAGLTSVYWLLRVHTQAPKEVHERLILMERSLALTMDLAATLAIGCGIALALHAEYPGAPNLFSRPGAGWFHIKLTIVVLGILSMHGMIRARVGKFSRGHTPRVPQWIWSVILISIVGVLVMVFRGPNMFQKKNEPPAAAAPASTTPPSSTP
jgi:uncharacterized membrane protein